MIKGAAGDPSSAEGGLSRAVLYHQMQQSKIRTLALLSFSLLLTSLIAVYVFYLGWMATGLTLMLANLGLALPLFQSLQKDREISSTTSVPESSQVVQPESLSLESKPRAGIDVGVLLDNNKSKLRFDVASGGKPTSSDPVNICTDAFVAIRRMLRPGSNKY